MLAQFILESKIIDRRRGPEIAGSRITVYDVVENDLATTAAAASSANGLAGKLEVEHNGFEDRIGPKLRQGCIVQGLAGVVAELGDLLNDPAQVGCVRGRAFFSRGFIPLYAERNLVRASVYLF